MIDLNDIWQPPPRYDLNEVRERLAASASNWLPDLFPQARRARDGRSLRCADLSCPDDRRAAKGRASCISTVASPAAVSTMRRTNTPAPST